MTQRNNYASPNLVMVVFKPEDVITTSAGVDPGHQDLYDTDLLDGFTQGGFGQ